MVPLEWFQPMREDVTDVTSSLIGWKRFHVTDALDENMFIHGELGPAWL